MPGTIEEEIAMQSIKNAKINNSFSYTLTRLYITKHLTNRSISLLKRIINFYGIYNNYIIKAGREYWGDSNKTYYANNYSKSSLRNWLINDFYEKAFNKSEQRIMLSYECNNSSCSLSYSKYNSDPIITNDKVFLLSFNEVANPAYGFSSDGILDDTAIMTGMTTTLDVLLQCL